MSARIAADPPPEPLPDAVSPQQAWLLASTCQALLVDVRSPEEYKFVGHVRDSVNVPWASGIALSRNPRFVCELEIEAGGKDRPILLMCRSGKGSALALDAARAAGFSRISHVDEGFEGDLDAREQRGHTNGWRYRGLPWLQE